MKTLKVLLAALLTASTAWADAGLQYHGITIFATVGGCASGQLIYGLGTGLSCSNNLSYTAATSVVTIANSGVVGNTGLSLGGATGTSGLFADGTNILMVYDGHTILSGTAGSPESTVLESPSLTSQFNLTGSTIALLTNGMTLTFPSALGTTGQALIITTTSASAATIGFGSFSGSGSFSARGFGVGGSGSTITAGNNTVSYSATSGSPYAANVSTANTVLVTVNANLTINGPTGGSDGQKVTFRLDNDATHAATFATGAGNFAFGTTVSTYTVSASSVDYVGAIYYNSGSKWHIVSESLGIK